MPAPRSADAEVRSVAKEGGWAGLFNLLGAGIRYGNQLILTRVLGAEAYGLYGLANVIVTVVSVPAGLGLPTSSVHFVASSAGTGEWGRLRWVVKAAFKLALFSSLAAALLIVDAPAAARWLVAFPLVIGAVGILQARLRFCAAYAAAGVRNFGALGSVERVEQAAARRADRAKAIAIFLAAGAIGLGGAFAFVLLPL